LDMEFASVYGENLPKIIEGVKYIIPNSIARARRRREGL